MAPQNRELWLLLFSLVAAGFCWQVWELAALLWRTFWVEWRHGGQAPDGGPMGTSDDGSTPTASHHATGRRLSRRRSGGLR